MGFAEKLTSIHQMSLWYVLAKCADLHLWITMDHVFLHTLHIFTALMNSNVISVYVNDLQFQMVSVPGQLS